MVACKTSVEEYMFILYDVLRIQDFTHVRGFENVSEELMRQIAYLHMIEPRANAGVRDELNLAAPPPSPLYSGTPSMVP